MVRENPNPPIEKSERKPRVVTMDLSENIGKRKPDTFEVVRETDIRADIVPEKKG